ncbi:MAG: YvcK family protein [Lachnospiraceae bacterium]|nr:YvcK family protein [Lachnospiraceae bacterium]
MIDTSDQHLRIVVFGGGTGLSVLLSGLKLFPLEVTTVISMSDNGSSTGVLRQELDIPAVGDVGKVILSMANTDSELLELLQYRFKKQGSLYNHPLRNILLAALIDLRGNVTEATKYMCRILNVRGTVLPLTEEEVDLVGRNGDRVFYGQVDVSRNIKEIDTLEYDHPIEVEPEVLERIAEADLVIFSPGSLYTSILPHLLADQVVAALEKTSAPIMYVSNLVTQPGETDDYSVSDHVKVLNRYLRSRKVDVVLANTGELDSSVLENYEASENKLPVLLDTEEVAALGARIISGDIADTSEGIIRHHSLKTGYIILSYLMDRQTEKRREQK